MYCGMEIRHGTIEVQLVNGEPVKRLAEYRDIRFDKEITMPFTIEVLNQT